MAFWSFYFFAKLLMYCGGFIGFHVLENLAFAVFTALPARHWLWRAVKQLIAVPLGMALLYYDSWLPPWQSVFGKADQMAAFSLAYFIELAQRFINYKLLLGLALALAVYWLLSRKLRLSSVAFLGILVAPWLGVLAGVTPPAAALPVAAVGAAAEGEGISSAQDLDTALDAFRQRELQRQLRFEPPASTDDEPYDIVLLQVCSLAWDDLDFVGQRRHPFLDRFNLRFENFSAAASYSGPAAIRLLRSGCGQSAHQDLYRPADPACHLMDGLQVAGFQPQWAMNHDGVFGNMLEDIADRGGLKAPLMPLTGLAPVLKAFDGSTYYRDYDVLSAWWKQRQQAPAGRVALYYNTGTLHDGNQFLDGSRPNARDSFQRRTGMLFEDLGRFFDEVQASGRRVVMVLVPEHGANVRGDRLQISGMREIPSPAIGLVPVGVKLIGRTGSEAPVLIDAPTSYFGLGSLLAGFAAANPFSSAAVPLAELAREVPRTEFVAENEGMLVMRAGGRYWLRNVDGSWGEYLAGR